MNEITSTNQLFKSHNALYTYTGEYMCVLYSALVYNYIRIILLVHCVYYSLNHESKTHTITAYILLELCTTHNIHYGIEL